MEFIKPGTNINFIGNRRIAFIISAILLISTVFIVIWRGGPNYGVDFTGGVLIQVKFDGKTSTEEIKNALRPVGLQDSIVQGFGEEGASEYLIRISRTDIDLPALSSRVKQSLKDEIGKGVDVRRVEMVGPKVGKDLRQKALFAIFYAILFIAIYISGRFELKWLMSIVMGPVTGFCGLHYLQSRDERNLADRNRPACNPWNVLLFEFEICLGSNYCHCPRCNHHHRCFCPFRKGNFSFYYCRSLNDCGIFSQ